MSEDKCTVIAIVIVITFNVIVIDYIVVCFVWMLFILFTHCFI